MSPTCLAAAPWLSFPAPEQAMACRYDYTEAPWGEQGISTMTARLLGSTCQLDSVQDAWVLGAMAMEHNTEVMRLALQLATLARRAGWDLDVGKHLSLLPYCRGEVQLCGRPLRVRLPLQDAPL